MADGADPTDFLVSRHEHIRVTWRHRKKSSQRCTVAKKKESMSRPNSISRTAWSLLLFISSAVFADERKLHQQATKLQQTLGSAIAVRGSLETALPPHPANRAVYHDAAPLISRRAHNQKTMMWHLPRFSNCAPSWLSGKTRSLQRRLRTMRRRLQRLSLDLRPRACLIQSIRPLPRQSAHACLWRALP